MNRVFFQLCVYKKAFYRTHNTLIFYNFVCMLTAQSYLAQKQTIP